LRKLLLALGAFAVAAAVFAGTAAATHSWNNYHWARTANPFALKVIDSHTADWDGHLNMAITDWSTSTVLDLVGEPGSDARNTRKRCPAVSGKVRACNAEYGFNGWLGIAQIWISGGEHIVQGLSKMNDSYFNTSRYNFWSARQQVECQEIGHTFGLGHQDESGADLDTCMDYSNALDNPSPNQHDYEQLKLIYAHPDSSSTVAAAASAGQAGNEHTNPVVVERNDRITNSVITERFADGTYRVTHIIWALDGPGRS
jgi:hypothetical protein